MPVYELRCGTCGVEFEKLVFSSGAGVACPGCGGSDVVKRPNTTKPGIRR